MVELGLRLARWRQRSARKYQPRRCPQVAVRIVGADESGGIYNYANPAPAPAWCKVAHTTGGSLWSVQLTLLCPSGTHLRGLLLLLPPNFSIISASCAVGCFSSPDIPCCLDQWPLAGHGLGERASLARRPRALIAALHPPFPLTVSASRQADVLLCVVLVL